MTTSPLHALVIDVRSPGEFAGGHLEGSVNLPLDRLEAEISRAAPDKATPIVLCCASGMRSAMGMQALQRMGYTRVSNGGGVGSLAMTSGRAVRRG